MDFEKMLEESLKEIRSGSITKGVIANVAKSMFLYIFFMIIIDYLILPFPFVFSQILIGSGLFGLEPFGLGVYYISHGVHSIASYTIFCTRGK